MASDPGEWYEERRAQAECLTHRLAGARAVLAALEAADGARMLEVARAVVRRLERALAQAEYVGD